MFFDYHLIYTIATTCMYNGDQTALKNHIHNIGTEVTQIIDYNYNCGIIYKREMLKLQ